MNPPFPPPPGAFYPNMPPLPLINMTGQFPMPPMGMIPMPVGIPTNQVVASIGITVPTGVTSISAPPVRKITPSVTNLTNPIASHHLPQVIKQTFIAQKTKSNYNGPIIPVFVGNINEKASDLVIRQILDKCGNVTNWKRVKGANGKLQAFGFCDYAEADSALRAIRLLHDFEIGDKKLVVKVDAKTKDKLDAYVKERNPKLKCTSDLVTEETRREDENVLNCIKNIIKENEVDMSKSEFTDDGLPRSMLNNSKTQIPSEPNLQNFSDMDIEDEKKTLIHREIGKFRNTYKKQDEEKEKLEAEKLKEKENKKDKSYEKDKDRREKDKERNRTPIRESSSRKVDYRYDRDRERDRDRFERSDRSDRTDRDSSRSNYEDEEFSERRRQERELRKKEQSYQVRLKNWESREERKQRQYEKEKMRAIEKKKEEEKEIKKLKEFLEDYNDDIDDNKYYKGSNLVKKLREREKEKEEDERDRRLEKKELDELRKKLAEEGHPDPESEAKKLMSNVKTNNNNKVGNLPTNGLIENENNFSQSNSPRNEEIHVKAFTLSKQDSHRQLNTIKGNKNNETATDTHITPISDFQNTDKKKKFSVHEVFNPNEDDDKSQITKKRKLPVFIDENTDSNQSLTSNLNKNSNDSKVLSSDDKRKQIKALIDNIPTTKEDLFKYEIQWDFVDSTLMEKRIRPWINKKITEYIGEEEKALLDFICNKLNARCNAQSILDDVAMVLDDEAEVFIVKMLRLLIYEIEAKKLGIGK